MPHVYILFPFCLQHNQWFCLTAEGGAQSVSAQSPASAAQSQVSQRLPPATRLLCCTVPRKRPQPN